MRVKSLGVVLVAAIAVACVGAASAGTVSSIPGGTAVAIPAVNLFTAGPETLAPGITWTSTNSAHQGGSVFGRTSGYNFAANGVWSGDPMVGLNDSTDIYGVTDSMTFSFATPVAAVGGFVNYVPGSSHPTTIAIYNAANTLLDSFELTFTTGGAANTGEFLGFSEATADIASFKLTDNYIGLKDLTILASPAPTSAPEPASLALLGAGLLGLAVVGRRFLA